MTLLERLTDLLHQSHKFDTYGAVCVTCRSEARWLIGQGVTLAPALAEAVEDVRLAAEANGHGWVTGTDAWERLLAAAGMKLQKPLDKVDATR